MGKMLVSVIVPIHSELVEICTSSLFVTRPNRIFQKHASLDEESKKDHHDSDPCSVLLDAWQVEGGAELGRQEDFKRLQRLHLPLEGRRQDQKSNRGQSHL